MGSLDLDSERRFRVNVPKGSGLPRRERWLSSAASVGWWDSVERWRRGGEGRSHLGWCAHRFSRPEVEPSLSRCGGSTPILKGYSKRSHSSGTREQFCGLEDQQNSLTSKGACLQAYDLSFIPRTSIAGENQTLKAVLDRTQCGVCAPAHQK